jgi:integrase/recombinase XerD
VAKRRSNELNIDELKVVSTASVTSNLTLSEVLELFIEDCQIRNLREHSIMFYRNEFNAFMALLILQGVELSVRAFSTIITENVIRGYAGARYKAPTAEVSMLKHRKEVIETLTVKQINELLNACNLRTFVGLRD